MIGVGALVIRAIEPRDAGALAAAKPSWASMAEPLLRAQEEGRGTTLIALLESSPVGLVELVWGEPVELRNLHVLSKARGRGCGTALIRAAEAAAAPARGMRLAVGVDNPDARRLYERLGYRPTGELETVTYEYIDDRGITRHATEASEYLCKDLEPVRARPERV